MTLLERVKELQGGNYEVDRLLTEQLGYPNIHRQADGSIPPNATIPAFTSSLDAAVELVERVRPDWHWTIYGPNGKDSTVCFDPPILSKQANVWATAKTPALALLTALLHSIPVQGD